MCFNQDEGVAGIQRITHTFRPQSERTVFTITPYHDMLSSVYVESIVLKKVTKRFDDTTSPSLLELRALQEDLKITCEELRPKCVPFDSSMFPFCEGRGRVVV